MPAEYRYTSEQGHFNYLSDESSGIRSHRKRHVQRKRNGGHYTSGEYQPYQYEHQMRQRRSIKSAMQSNSRRRKLVAVK